MDSSGILTTEQRVKFTSLHRQYDSVFDTATTGLYNGSSGHFTAKVNMGRTLPPQREGRLPFYLHADKVLLQEKCDELVRQNILARPEDLGIVAEYVNTSFLVRKPNGGYRLVTAFGEVAQYCKPQPSLLHNVDETLRTIGQWSYMVKTDLS